MRDATAAQTQSAPQVSQTPQTSYVAPQTAAQAPSVAGGSTDNTSGTSTTSASPDGVQGLQSATAYNPSHSRRLHKRRTHTRTHSTVVGPWVLQFPFQGQQSQATPAADQGNYGYQQTTQYSNPAQRLICL